MRRRIDDAKQRTLVQSTVEKIPKISRSESMAVMARRGSAGFEANDDEVPSSRSRTRSASLDDKDDAHSQSLLAERLLQRRPQEARAIVQSKAHEAAADEAPRSKTPMGPKRRASLPRLLQRHMSSDTVASVAQSYKAHSRNNVHLYEMDRSASESSSDESLSFSRLGDSALLDEVAMELASSATRNSSSGETTITAEGNFYLKSCGKYGNDDDDDDDDSVQGSIPKTATLSDANRLDKDDDLCMYMKKFGTSSM